MKTPEQIAAALDRLLRRAPDDDPDRDLFTEAAQGLRTAAADHAREFRRAEAALLEVSTLRAELTQARADARALEAVITRSAEPRPS